MSAIGKLFGGAPAAATITAPKLEPVPTLTTANSARAQQDKLRLRRRLSARQGRASTLLTPDKDREFKNVDLG